MAKNICKFPKLGTNKPLQKIPGICEIVFNINRKKMFNTYGQGQKKRWVIKVMSHNMFSEKKISSNLQK